MMITGDSEVTAISIAKQVRTYDFCNILPHFKLRVTGVIGQPTITVKCSMSSFHTLYSYPLFYLQFAWSFIFSMLPAVVHLNVQACCSVRHPLLDIQTLLPVRLILFLLFSHDILPHCHSVPCPLLAFSPTSTNTILPFTFHISPPLLLSQHLREELFWQSTPPLPLFPSLSLSHCSRAYTRKASTRESWVVRILKK